MVKNRQVALSIVVLILLVGVLACTSNDTLFIKLTPTPLPTATREAVSTGTRFAKNDRVYAIGLGKGLNVDLYDAPGSTKVNHLETCFRNSPVTITEVARNTAKADDPFIYYEINCSGAVGWLPEYSLSKLNPKNGKALVKSEDGKGAIIYKKADPTSDEVGTCEEGTKVTINDIVPVIDEAKPEAVQFVRMTCNKIRGFILETQLVPDQA